MKTKSKSIFGPCQQFEFRIIRLIGKCYGLVTGKNEYKLSFKLFNKRVGIEKYRGPAEDKK